MGGCLWHIGGRFLVCGAVMGAIVIGIWMNHKNLPGLFGYDWGAVFWIAVLIGFAIAFLSFIVAPHS